MFAHHRRFQTGLPRNRCRCHQARVDAIGVSKDLRTTRVPRCQHQGSPCRAHYSRTPRGTTVAAAWRTLRVATQSHLERVLAVNLREVIGELKSRTDFIRRQKRIAAQGRESADSEGGKPAVLLALRDALNAKGGGNAAQVDWPRETRESCGDSSRPARATFTSARGENVGIGQCALLRECRLVALLETAAVRDSSENSGDEVADRRRS